jgi:hypothetical protein
VAVRAARERLRNPSLRGYLDEVPDHGVTGSRSTTTAWR